jgi:two-component system OmpR family sensor kinase
MRLSLSLRLTLLYVGLLALLLVALGLMLYLDTRQFVVDSTAVRLRAQAKPVIERWLAAPRTAPPLVDVASDLARSLTSRDTAAVIVDAGGTVLADGRRLPEEPVAAPIDRERIARALAGDNEVTYTVDGPARQLVLLIPLRESPGAGRIVGIAQLSTPLQPIDALLDEQRHLIGLGIAIAIGLGTAGGLWLTRHALAPLRRMILTCRRIADGDFSQRVGLPGRHDEIGQLAESFDQMVEHIESTLAGQRRFIANAAHELRNPLTALKGSLEVLMRGADDDHAARDRLAQGMHREVTRLGVLCEQMLDLSLLESAPTLRRQPVDLGPYLQDFLRLASLLAPAQEVELEAGAAGAAAIDPDSIQQALVNLVVNAAQHTAPGGIIRLGWALRPEAVELRVSDTGEGIAEQDLPHVFEPLYRGDASRSRRQGGAGLGLALVKRIVDLHGGSVAVDSRPGQGSTFTMTLPRAA